MLQTAINNYPANEIPNYNWRQLHYFSIIHSQTNQLTEKHKCNQ